ncbi:hypothetical protein Plhal304r1_c080g0165821 [Plasmopara halstedii]
MYNILLMRSSLFLSCWAYLNRGKPIVKLIERIWKTTYVSTSRTPKTSGRVDAPLYNQAHKFRALNCQ